MLVVEWLFCTFQFPHVPPTLIFGGFSLVKLETGSTHTTHYYTVLRVYSTFPVYLPSRKDKSTLDQLNRIFKVAKVAWTLCWICIERAFFITHGIAFWRQYFYCWLRRQLANDRCNSLASFLFFFSFLVMTLPFCFAFCRNFARNFAELRATQPFFESNLALKFFANTVVTRFSALFGDPKIVH